jgi:hypothetical protein
MLPAASCGVSNPKPSKQLHLDLLTMELLIRFGAALLLDFGAPQAQRRLTAHRYQVLALVTVQTAVLDVSDLFRSATREHFRHQASVLGGLIARMGVLKRLPMIGKDLLEDTPVPRECCQHRIAPSGGRDDGDGAAVVPHLTGSIHPLLSVHRASPHNRSNCLQINDKK